MAVNRRDFMRGGRRSRSRGGLRYPWRRPRRGAGQQDCAGKRHRPALRLQRFASAAMRAWRRARPPTTCRWTTTSASGLWDTPLELSGKTYTVIKVYHDGTAEQ